MISKGSGASSNDGFRDLSHPGESCSRWGRSSPRRVCCEDCADQRLGFGRLKDWRGIATRYERCGDIFLDTIVLAAIIIF